MRRISLYKKVRFFREYLKIIKSNKIELNENFGSRVDWVGRIYTVVNVPVESFGDAYNLKKADIDNISKSYIEEYRNGISKYLNSIQLVELYKEYSVEKVSKYSYLVIVGYSLFNSYSVAKNILFKVLPTILVILSILFYFFF